MIRDKQLHFTMLICHPTRRQENIMSKAARNQQILFALEKL